MENKREILALVGAGCILFAVLTNNVLSFEGQGVELGVGFRGLSICSGGNCASTNAHSGLGTFVFILGLASAAALVGAIAVERTQDNDRLWRPAGGLTVFFIFMVIAWYIDMSMGGASIGIGLWLGIPGACAAAYVCLATDGGEGMATFERVAERKEDIEAGLAKYYKNPVGGAAAAPDTSGSAPNARRASGLSISPPNASAPGVAAEVQAPTANAQPLRFVAASAVISDEGIRATFADGGTQVLRFGEVKQLVARRLPIELGHGASLLLDLVASDRPNQPIRILPSTQVNYAYLPEGASLDDNANVRGLVKLVRILQPELTMDEGTKLFADGTSAALPFKSVDHFWQYDGRYPA